MVKVKLSSVPVSAVLALVLAAAVPALPAAADEVLSNPTQCEISTKLGIQASGCPAAASVGNGDEPPTRGLTVGNSGALSGVPSPQTQAIQTQNYRAAFKINFKFGSAQLTDDAKLILGRIGAVLSAADARDMSFKIVGHTDSVGAADANQRLSENRAMAVREYLVQTFQLNADRVSAEGLGSRQPFNSGNSKAAENRRVEVINLGRRP
ncbi:putative Outer membrane protein OmpA-like peptidoglycan-associated protein [uncultured Gammaproteobacteria bacterium]